MQAVQKAALKVIGEVLAGHNLNEVLQQAQQRMGDALPGDRAAVQDICYGTLRHLGLLRAVLKQLLQKPLDEPVLEQLLLLALYQLRFTKAAPYAIVDHAVTLASRTGSGRGKGLVNAVLRNYLRQHEALLAKAEHDPVGRWSHPAWWIEALQAEYPQHWQSVLEAGNQHPPMTLRINRGHTDVDGYLRQLLEAGIAAKALDAGAIRLLQPVGVDRLPGFADGWVSVQDWGAQAAASLLDLQAGQRVLDACAAPGGKTGHMLELADVQLTALDSDAARLQKVAQNLQRIGKNATLLQGDAGEPAGWWDGKPFERILADVPCSASGVVRRHPDIKWLRRHSDVAKFATTQAKIIDSLWQLLAPGGKLLYATCSIFPQENRLQAEQFALRHADAERLPLPQAYAEQFLPDADHDGFYYALFRKQGG